MKKKLIVLIPIFFAFILSITAVNTFAADKTVAVASTDFKTHQGETFMTTLNIPDGANIVDFDITLTYDTNNITLVSAVENENIKGTVVFNTETAGVIHINYTRSSKNVTSYLPLIDLTFKVNDNIGVGMYDCLTVNHKATYLAHRLNTSGTLEAVDFDCNFAKLIIYEMGDVDLSCSVDIGDATYIRRHLAQFDGAILTDFKLTLADTYTDGVVDIADSVCLQRHLAKMDVMYGNRVNITFYDGDGNKYVTKSVYYDGTLNSIPIIPEKTGYTGGKWSQSADEYVAPVYTNLKNDINLYVYYDPGAQTTEAIEYYKKILNDMYYSGDLATNLSSNMKLQTELYYQSGYHASLVWNSDCNYVLNGTTGNFTKPTYPQDLSLSIKIISYNAQNVIEGEDTIKFTYKVPGVYQTPTKSDVEKFLQHYFTDSSDGKYRVNYDAKLISKVNNTVIPVEGSMYDNFEIRLAWYQNVNGSLVPINQIKRTTSSQVNDYVAVATFNGKPLEDDGKIYIDNVEVTPIEQMEIKNYIIQQVAANQGTLATDGKTLWNNDTVYGTSVTWESGNTKTAYVADNKIQLKKDAVTGSTLPLNARVSYAVNDEVKEFILSYNLTVSCDNTLIKYPENMDEQLYKAIKTELEDTLGYRGDLTSAALADVRFVNLNLSGYPDISSLRGLSYCTNLRTLNISGLKITDGTMNQIATLSYLEAFIARDCGLDNLTDGGTATLRNAVGLKLIDLTNNNFTSLDSVFAQGVRYGKLREVYLSSNKLTDINALSRAPMMAYLSLADNGLTTAGTASIANYPFLTYLSLANNKIDSVENLTGLRYLTELRLQNNDISDIRDLRKLTNLEILYLGHNKIPDVGFLNTLVKLSILYINDNQIASVSELTGLTNLEAINVSNNKITSLAVLNNSKSNITEIYAENNKLTDFSFINGASKLHILMLSGNNVTLAQDNMTTWLNGLTNLEVLTLSDIKLNDLSFLSVMTKLVRLDVANCGITSLHGDISNLAKIAERYSTLKVLDISNNNFNDKPSEIMNLRNVTLLTLLYADNICNNLDIDTLTYSMTELKYVSFENCGITSMSWLSKFNALAYVDLAGNAIADVNLDSFISNSSKKTIKELYLDTTADCTFTNAYYVADFNVEKLSLQGVNVGKVENLPYLDYVTYLNLDNTGLTNLTGNDLEMLDSYSVKRFAKLNIIDVSHNETDIAILESMKSLNKIYAVGSTDSKLFYKDNLHTLQRLYNNGIECYLYNKQTKYSPVSKTEGDNILSLIDDFSGDVKVAANNVLSDNNPFITDKINDFDITWTLSNNVNYEIVNNHLAVKNYAGIEDETLTVTATITVYPDQAPVSRDFTINTHILRVSPDYYSINAAGYSPQLTRDSVFTYNVTLKPNVTEGFTNPVMPVEDSVDYSYSAVTSTDTVVPYVNVLTVNANNCFAVTSNAPLNSTTTIKINISHNNKDGTKINDIPQIEAPLTVVSRTFTATFVLNGGTLIDGNSVNRESSTLVEDSLIFDGLYLSRSGYVFDGWYTDAEFTNLFSSDYTTAVMPSHNITLYAKWTALSYTVNFDANGGTVSPTSMTALSDVEIGTLPTPTRQYYTFNGWYTAASGGTKVTSTSKFARTENLTLYAQWTLNSFVITFNANGGSVNTTSLRAYCGNAIGTLPTPTRDYYTFNGWYTAASNGTKVTNVNTYSVANNFTLYAHWIINPELGWIKATNLPSGAQITQTKWAYTLRSYTTSGSSSLDGWTKYDTQRTSWGPWSSWSTWNPSNGIRNVEWHSAYDHTEYHYYRWTNGSIMYTYQYNSSYWLEETWFTYVLPTSCKGESIGYVDNSDTGANRWTRADYAGNYSVDKTWSRDIYRDEWRYQDPIYTYYYYKDDSKETTSDPTGQSNVSNVVKYVMYRTK